MSPGRNDPCPCGSGRKYKLCCQATDAARVAGEAAAGAATFRARGVRHRPELLAAIRAEEEWAADAFPLPIAMEDANSRRPVALLVTAGELVVYSETLDRLGGGAEAVADALERALQNAARNVGNWPDTVVVRHVGVADALAPRLRPREVSVGTGETPGLVAAATALLEHMAGRSLWPPASGTDRWRDWELPDRLVGDIFAAAARFYRDAPWAAAGNYQAPRAVLPAGREWTCCILGQGGDAYGLVLYGDPADLFRVFSDDERAGLGGMTGPVLSLTFDRLAELPAAAVQELRTRRWPIAGPAAYPRLLTINTPGGGVSVADAHDLLLLLQAVPAWADAHAHALEDEAETGVPLDPVRWTHASGVVFEYPLEGVADDGDDDDDADALLPPDVHGELHAIVANVRAELGPDASDDAFMAEVNRRIGPTMAALNRQPRDELGGLSPEQVRQLLAADWEQPNGVLRLNRDLAVDEIAAAPFVANARTLLGLGLATGTLPATQSGNLKPALVDALLPRLAWVDAREAAFSREYHTRTRETDFRELHRLRVVCEQARLLNRRSTRYDLTANGRRLAADAHAGELFAELFVTWFRHFDIAYTTRIEWPELQQQIAYTLYRLPSAAHAWSTAESLLPQVVLPFALETYDRRGGALRHGAFAFEYLALDAFAGFGLLERHVENESDFMARTVRFRATPLLARFVEATWNAAATE